MRKTKSHQFKIVLVSIVVRNKKTNAMSAHFKNTLYFILIACFSFGCASVYVPSVRNVPLFTKRGEFQIQTSFGKGANANAAYAVTNHIAISAGAMYANNKVIFKKDWRVHQSAEASLGFYGNRKKLAFEVFGGYGVGKGISQEAYSGCFLIFCSSSLDIAKSKYNKLFIQPSVGFKIKRIQLIGTMRVTYLNFQTLSVRAYQSQPIESPVKTFFSIEPSFSIKFFPTKKYNPLFIFGQSGFNLVSIPEHPDVELQYFILHYSVGVGLKI